MATASPVKGLRDLEVDAQAIPNQGPWSKISALDFKARIPARSHPLADCSFFNIDIPRVRSPVRNCVRLTWLSFKEPVRSDEPRAIDARRFLSDVITDRGVHALDAVHVTST